MKYPETTGSILNANEGAKCYSMITWDQAEIILERINGQALHKCTIFSAQLIDSLELPERNIPGDKRIINFKDCFLSTSKAGTVGTSKYYIVLFYETAFLKKINVSNNPRIVRESLQSLNRLMG